MRRVLSLLPDLRLRTRKDQARATLVEEIVRHGFQPDTIVSLTLAFYAFWLAQARGKDGPFLDRHGAERIWACFRAGTGWPEELASRLRALLIERHPGLA